MTLTGCGIMHPRPRVTFSLALTLICMSPSDDADMAVDEAVSAINALKTALPPAEARLAVAAIQALAAVAKAVDRLAVAVESRS
jgi:hypothetical protein